MEKDFNKWLMGRPNWSEIAFEYNTGKKYQHKQDLVAVFWNSYIYFQQKAESYFKEFGVLPYEVLNELKFEFKQKFSESGRVDGVNYFDDLIGQLIDKYEKSKIESKPFDKNENILELTKENLVKCGFDSDLISKLLTWDNYKQTTQNNLGTFFASNIENKIYMGIEAHRKIYLGDKENPRFPFNELSLIPEYYELAQLNFLKASEKRLTSIYNEQTEKQKFRAGEIRKASEIFKECEAKPHLRFNHNNRRFVIWNDYLNWLNNPNQSEPNDKANKDINLTPFEIALRHSYLVKYDVLKYIKGAKVGETYKELGNAKNIELKFNDLENNRRKPKIEELQKVSNTLNEYPLIQKAIANDIDLPKPNL